jgi:hypothetical protein
MKWTATERRRRRRTHPKEVAVACTRAGIIPLPTTGPSGCGNGRESM